MTDPESETLATKALLPMATKSVTCKSLEKKYALVSDE
jgi:hypothetical protein